MLQLHSFSTLSCWVTTYFWTTRSLANAVTLLRTFMVLGVAFTVISSGSNDETDGKDTFLCTLVPWLTISAVLDIVDGMLARRFGSWSSGRALDLLADILLWTVLYGTATSVVAASTKVSSSSIRTSWNVFVCLILSLEWTTTIAVLQNTSDDWRKSPQDKLTFPQAFLSTYLRNNLRNPLAAWAILSHFTCPILYVMISTSESDDTQTENWLIPLMLCTVGLLLYLYATLAMLLAATSKTALSSSSSQIHNQPKPTQLTLPLSAPLFWIFVFHFLTSPLAVLLLHAPKDDTKHHQTQQSFTDSVTSTTIVAFLLVRLVTFVLFYYFYRSAVSAIRVSKSSESAATTRNNPLTRRTINPRSHFVLLLGDLWCTFMPLIAYTEVGAILPLLHSESFLQDMGIDHALLKLEASWFGGAGAAEQEQPSVAWQPTNPFWKEFWHAIYVSHTPAIALAGIYYMSRKWRFPFTKGINYNGSSQPPVVKDTSSMVLSNMLCTNFACHLIYLTIPTYGPLFTLDSIGSSSVLEVASSTTRNNIANGVVALGQRFASTGTACPSSHCATAACICLTLMCSSSTARWIKYISIIWSVSICISTVFCGMHYVLDVLCGMLVGATCCSSTIYKYYYYSNSIRHSTKQGVSESKTKRL